MTIAVYAGTFDPITYGHLDIIKRSLKLCDQLIIAIGSNSSKKTMFGNIERIKMIDRALQGTPLFIENTVKVDMFDGLLVDYAKSQGANILVRGIRSVSDFEYEINLANINKTLAPNIETVFLPTSPDLGVVSSSAVKEIVKYGGDVSKFVPPFVATYVKEAFGFIKFGDDKK